MGALLSEILDALDNLTLHALPERLDAASSGALQDPCDHSLDVGPASVAAATLYTLSGATVGFPNVNAS